MPKKPAYTKDVLKKVLAEIKEGGCAIKAMSRKYSIPRPTLRFHLKKSAPTQSFGPTPYLSHEEEEAIERWIIDMARKGFPRKKSDEMDTVQNFLNANPRPTPFANNRPGYGWLRAFLKRHPMIVERSSEGVTKASACVTEYDIRKWFGEIKSYLNENGLMDVFQDPSRIFNADETRFQTCPSTGRVLAPKGEKNLYAVDQESSKENMTVLFTFSADGKTCPPLVVNYAYKRLPEKVASTIPSDWGIARSDTGWMTADVFLEFISEIFSPYLTKNNIQRPVVLFIIPKKYRTHMPQDENDFICHLCYILHDSDEDTMDWMSEEKENNQAEDTTEEKNYEEKSEEEKSVDILFDLIKKKYLIPY